MKSNKNKLSVVLATKNEENNLKECLNSVKAIADEIIIFDENSNDETTSIAKSFGAKITNYVHTTNFHETKQKAIDSATGDWILQLDADERVSPELSKEIISIINSSNEELLGHVVYRPEQYGSSERHPERMVSYVEPVVEVSQKGNEEILHSVQKDSKNKLFKRHQKLIEEREGHLGKPTGEVVAFFIPRVNYFVGKPLLHAGVYPDGVIRLIKRGKARLPAKSVHEVMEVDGEVGWLFNDLEHHESPTLHRYIERANRYTDLAAKELAKSKTPKNSLFLIHYSLFKPLWAFLNLYLRHKGYKDGIRGFLWSFFSAFHFPLSYWKYYVDKGGADNG